MTGTVEAIHTAPAARAPVVARREVALLAGRGIHCDRYAAGAGTFSDWPQDHELTLIAAEALEAVAAEWGVALGPNDHRRNLVTRGVRLDDLLGRRFRVGEAVCEGTRPCPPCAHLENITGIGGLARLLAGRGGLRAVIRVGGRVRVGDAVMLIDGDGADGDDEKEGATR